MDMKISDRDSSIDLLKGLGIVAVILGHLEIPMLLRSFIYMFHMPLFFFLSGYLRKEKSYKACDIWSRYAKKLLYPYFAGGGIDHSIQYYVGYAGRKFYIQKTLEESDSIALWKLYMGR